MVRVDFWWFALIFGGSRKNYVVRVNIMLFALIFAKIGKTLEKERVHHHR
jgi:hypothetical protein